MKGQRRRRRRGTGPAPRRSRAPWLIGGVLVVAVVAILSVLALRLSGPSATGREAPPTAVAGRAPEAPSVPDLPNFRIIVYQGADLLGGETVDFRRVLSLGRPVVLNYWASNCPPCSAEMPEFEKVWQRYRDRVLFLGLDVGRFYPAFGDQEESKRELKRLGVTYPAGTPETPQAVNDLRVQTLPSTVFIRPDGKVFTTWYGPLNESKLTDILRRLLNASG